MTVANITGGFRVTGIYPENRHAQAPPSLECEHLGQDTGLAFILMYSPILRCTCKPVAEEFTEEETSPFETHDDNGYDVT